MAKKYLDRIVDSLLDKYLQSSGAVLIEGAKWCGKTWTGKQKAKSVLMMQHPDEGEAYHLTASISPRLLLEGETPRLIDEWQTAPQLWDAVRYEVDERGEIGQFILTGSALPQSLNVRHSGVGRIAHLKMRPMSLYESTESTGGISLKELFEGVNEISAISRLDINEIAKCIVRGGWPASIGFDFNIGMQISENYVEAIINQNISSMDEVGRNSKKVRQLLRSLSRNIASTASNETLRKDMLQADESITIPTITTYLDALERLYVIENQPAWTPRLRSKTALRTKARWHFVDPSIATATLRLSPDALMKDFNTFGFLFEALCIRDLRVYAQANDGEVFYYRDKTELEADAILALHDGRWAAVEIKMGAKQVDEAAENLLKLREKVELNQPAFLMVLTATKYAYKRDDGVLVVPLGCLGA